MTTIEFWERAFLAALTGASSCDGVGTKDAVTYAEETADAAAKTWSERMEKHRMDSMPERGR